MMKIMVVQTRETAKFVYYETLDMESVFKIGLIAIKLWVPKAEFGPEAAQLGVYPEVIEVGILDDSDKKEKDANYLVASAIISLSVRLLGVGVSG